MDRWYHATGAQLSRWHPPHVAWVFQALVEMAHEFHPMGRNPEALRKSGEYLANRHEDPWLPRAKPRVERPAMDPRVRDFGELEELPYRATVVCRPSSVIILGSSIAQTCHRQILAHGEIY